MMEFRFDGKIAVVTGAGQGIGKAIAKALAQGGAVVHALSKTQPNLDKLKQEEPSVTTHLIDISDWDKTREVLNDIGPVDLLVNNAARGELVIFIDVTEEQVDRLFEVNVKAVLNISQVVAKGMKKRGKGGSIVNISGIGSQRACPMLGLIGITKAAVDMLTKVMAVELGPYQIRVNAVNPTLTRTEQVKQNWNDPEKAQLLLNRMNRTPQAKFAEVCDVVRPVLYLLSDKADMINGVTLPVDGGMWAC